MTPAFDPKRMVFLIAIEPEDGEEPDNAEVYEETLYLTLAGHYDVCPRCSGQGTHWHPAFDNGITQEDRERDWDDESWDELMSGRYDVPCETCQGKRVVPVPNDPPTPQDQAAFDLWTARAKDEAAYRAEVAMERRMGC